VCACVCACVCVSMPCASILIPPRAVRSGGGGAGWVTPLAAPRVLPNMAPDWGQAALVGLPGIQAGAGGHRWAQAGTGGHCRFRGWPSCIASSTTRTVEMDGWPAPPKVWFPDTEYHFSPPRPSVVGQTRPPFPPPSSLYRHSIYCSPEHEPGRLGRPPDEGKKWPDARVAGMTRAATASLKVGRRRLETRETWGGQATATGCAAQPTALVMAKLPK
jgi:hypothetical protein